MGPDKETGVAYCSVGALVWVRRRNGSWWPGKIVGPEELSDAHLLSPRSGTPVKLLGREDASVDWYNLEKSKRVKAFRCGEFDDCIERAESSLGMPPKKREKYARREDAILHALELEKQLLGGEYSKLGCSSNDKSSKSSDPAEKVLVSPSESLGKDSGKHMHPQSHFKKLDSATDDKSMDQPLHAQKIKEGNLLVRDEDNLEPIPRTRMRGLQNIGLEISHSKRKIPSSVASNSSRDPGFDNSTENTVQASYLDQRMKSNEVLTDESLVRRRDRRRPLDQVLQSSAKFPVHSPRQYGNGNIPILMSEEERTGVIRCAKRGRFVDFPGESSDFSDGKQFCTNQMVIPPSQFEESNCPHPAALDEETASEDTESDSSETDSVDSDADEEIVALSDAALVTELEAKSPRSSGTQVPHGSMSSEELDDLALSNDASHLFPRDLVGVSKWKLKGKRNNRGVPNRSTVFRSSTYRTNLEEWKSNTRDEPDLTENNFRRSGSFDKQRFLLPSKSTSKGLDDFTHKIIDWEDSWNDQLVARRSPSESSWKRYWEEDSSNYFDPVLVGHYNSGGRMKSMLVDVDLKVQSSYQREHVPLISLMSKLNGKAIIGHPIQIEALENGASEILLSAADGIENDDTEEPPVWRTSTRTAKFRVRRPHPLSELVDDSFGHKAIRPRFNFRKYAKKQPKKISLSSGKKIKALSSIGTEQKLRNSLRGVKNFQVDSLIKGGSGPTAVACIPVKLVFSRLYEEMVGRHQ